MKSTQPDFKDDHRALNGAANFPRNLSHAANASLPPSFSISGRRTYLLKSFTKSNARNAIPMPPNNRRPNLSPILGRNFKIGDKALWKSPKTLPPLPFPKMDPRNPPGDMPESLSRTFPTAGIFLAIPRNPLSLSVIVLAIPTPDNAPDNITRATAAALTGPGILETMAKNGSVTFKASFNPAINGDNTGRTKFPMTFFHRALSWSFKSETVPRKLS